MEAVMEVEVVSMGMTEVVVVTDAEIVVVDSTHVVNVTSVGASVVVTSVV